MQTEFDFIVVGAGSAGCALAYRLAKQSSKQVLLLEAGSPARNPMMHIPLGFAFLMKPHKNNWGYQTQPELHAAQRVINLPRGKVMGGTSALNGMVYVRGQAEDFDRWSALGNKGWSYQEVLPYFRRSEHNVNGSNDYHGSDGPLWVSNVNNEFPLCDAFIAAAREAGHPYNEDINGSSQEGVGFYQVNIRNGRRYSSASAFLNRGIKPNNLTVISHAEVDKVIFNDKCAAALTCKVKGKPVTLTTRQEIVLCAGAINSPAILERSGVGDREKLAALGISTIQHLSGVGENLHDHWNAYVKRSVSQGRTYFSESKPLAMLKNLFRYALFRTSFLANPAALVAVFYKALSESERADAQIHFAAAASQYDKAGNMAPMDGVTISSCGTRPTSRGSTHISSRNAHTQPAITLNYLQTEYDQHVALEAFKKMRSLFNYDALKPFGGEELEPGPAVQADDEILDYIRATGEPVHHLAGSCKMGHDERAVVDSQLRVRGVTGLRIADAAIMPEIVSGNTHASCVMIGEKAADLLLDTH